MRDDGFFALEEVCENGDLYDRLLNIYKKLKEEVLNEDFDEAGQRQGERQKRFSRRTGSGPNFKEVKVRLEPELLDVLNAAVGDGNRTVWIEDAIVRKLNELGIEYELPEQPPLPNQ